MRARWRIDCIPLGLYVPSCSVYCIALVYSDTIEVYPYMLSEFYMFELGTWYLLNDAYSWSYVAEYSIFFCFLCIFPLYEENVQSMIFMY